MVRVGGADMSGTYTFMLGGAHAADGSVRAQQAHLVGELGPELFISSSSGRIVKLKQADSAALEALTHRGRESVRVLRRARVLQLLAAGWTVVGVAEAAGTRRRSGGVFVLSWVGTARTSHA
ncbi:hypothetical protein [Corallococcus aberystwythensis]|uniref:Uncharacterized protein n=1 Tax=Corallococcus aberystwythensis TaxID=2316722 RepID=A0A3A8R8W0_9BACT|nr:hypothetical protein [Corallococcus aberystwythensis]RKH73702.1 hypothetical protein D7W81_03345 [Corallococcus aberystwythensis]